MPQIYTVTRVNDGDSEHRCSARTSPTPPVNIGPRSTPNYEALAAAAVNTLPGGIKVFAGQRDDPFFVDLGSVFDLAGLRPFNPLHVIPLRRGEGVDGVRRLQHALDRHPGADRPARRARRPDDDRRLRERQPAEGARCARQTAPIDDNGPWVQVSRLGEPLINEVVIPLGQKDYWNASDPADDAQFASYYRDPEVTRLENALYPRARRTPTRPAATTWSRSC